MVVFLALLSMSWFLGSFIIDFTNQQLMGFTSTQLSELKEIPAELATRFKLAEMTALVVMLLIPAVLFAYLAYPKPAQYLKLNFKIRYYHWLFALLIMAAAMPFSGLLEEWSAKLTYPGQVKEMDDRYTTLAKSMLSGTHWSDLMLNIVAISIIPAVIEEIFFRGCLQNVLLSWMRPTPFVALLITAIIFSAFHGQLSGFIPRVFLGLLLGLGYHYSGSLWVAILMHAFNNFISVVMVYLFNNHYTPIDVTQLPPVNSWLAIVSLLVTLSLIYYYYKLRVPHQYIEVEKDDEPTQLNESK